MPAEPLEFSPETTIRSPTAPRTSGSVLATEDAIASPCEPVSFNLATTGRLAG
jgi:hypothetical protein